MAEWILTVEPAPYEGAPCNDCADLIPGPSNFHVVRGRSIHTPERDLGAAGRGLDEPHQQGDAVDIRCAPYARYRVGLEQQQRRMERFERS